MWLDGRETSEPSKPAISSNQGGSHTVDKPDTDKKETDYAAIASFIFIVAVIILLAFALVYEGGG